MRIKLLDRVVFSVKKKKAWFTKKMVLFGLINQPKLARKRYGF